MSERESLPYAFFHVVAFFLHAGVLRPEIRELSAEPVVHDLCMHHASGQ